MFGRWLVSFRRILCFHASWRNGTNRKSPEIHDSGSVLISSVLDRLLGGFAFVHQVRGPDAPFSCPRPRGESVGSVFDKPRLAVNIFIRSTVSIKCFLAVNDRIAGRLASKDVPRRRIFLLCLVTFYRGATRFRHSIERSWQLFCLEK